MLEMPQERIDVMNDAERKARQERFEEFAQAQGRLGDRITMQQFAAPCEHGTSVDESCRFCRDKRERNQAMTDTPSKIIAACDAERAAIDDRGCPR